MRSRATCRSNSIRSTSIRPSRAAAASPSPLTSSSISTRTATSSAYVAYILLVPLRIYFPWNRIALWEQSEFDTNDSEELPSDRCGTGHSLVATAAEHHPRATRSTLSPDPSLPRRFVRLHYRALRSIDLSVGSRFADSLVQHYMRPEEFAPFYARATASPASTTSASSSSDDPAAQLFATLVCDECLCICTARADASQAEMKLLRT